MFQYKRFSIDTVLLLIILVVSRPVSDYLVAYDGVRGTASQVSAAFPLAAFETPRAVMPAMQAPARGCQGPAV